MKQVIIDRDYVFTGQIADFISAVQNIKKVNVSVFSDCEIKLSPTISWGTMTSTGGLSFIDGINVKVLLSKLSENSVQVNFKTSVRPEHYIIIVIFIGFGIAVSLSDEPSWLYVYLFGLWIIMHLWFQFIYRFQENRLVEKLVDKLELKRM